MTTDAVTDPTEPAGTAEGGGGATADLWFDPTCPWAWSTSRWLKQVATVRPVTPRLRVMSLAVLHEHRDLPPEYRAALDRSWGPVRLCVAVEVGHGAAALDRLYTALGTRIHGRGEEVGRPLLEGALADAGLPGDLADAGWSTAWDERVRASHHDAMARVGPEVGTPVLGVGDVAFFGPVVSPPPAGEAAGRLWDGLVLVMTTPGFYELKRARTQGPRST